MPAATGLSWGDFSAAEPELAAEGLPLLRRGIAYLATVSARGAPRVHPVTPIFSQQALLLSIAAESPKLHDLQRDGRFALHALPGQDDAEFYLSGRVQLVTDAARRAQAHDDASFSPRDGDPLYELRLRVVLWSRWENVGQPGTYPVRRLWRLDV